MMVFYGINLFHLAEELLSEDPWLLTPLYADDAAFDGLEQRSAHLLKLLTERGQDSGYFTDPTKLLFIAD